MSNYIQLISRLAKLALVLIIIGVAYWCYQNYDSVKKKFYDTFVPHQTVWAGTPVIESIRNMRKLISATYYEEIVEVRSKRRILPPTPDDLVIIYRITVKAGYDLSNLSEDNIRLVGDTAIYVQLPAPGVFEPICNADDQTVYHDSNKWSDNELKQIKQSALNKAEHNAKSAGILDKAITNGCKCITQLLCSFGFEPEHVHVYVRN